MPRVVPWARKEFSMTIGAIIGTIIFGAVIGILARAVLPAASPSARWSP